MKPRYKAVVAGATGVVGRRLAEHLVSTGEWEVLGLARRPPKTPAPFTTICADLTSADDCREKLSDVRYRLENEDDWYYDRGELPPLKPLKPLIGPRGL